MRLQFLAAAVICRAAAFGVAAQSPPDSGSARETDRAGALIPAADIVSMGQPHRFHVYGSALAELAHPFGPLSVSGIAALGIGRDIGNPVTGLLRVDLEALIAQNARTRGALRPMLGSPGFFTRVGVEYDLASQHTNLLLSFHPPLFGWPRLPRGAQLRLDWVVTRRHALGVGVTVPLFEPWPARRVVGHPVVVLPGKPKQGPRTRADERVLALLGRVGSDARYLTLYSGAVFDNSQQRRESTSLDALRAVMRRWRDTFRLADAEFPRGHGYAAVLADYHRSLEGAIGIAAGYGPADSVAARRVTDALRGALLDSVLLPYDRLIGRIKRRDNLEGLGAAADARLAAWLRDSTSLEGGARARVQGVLAAVVRTADDCRRWMRDSWGGDSRLVWVPLQLALRPDQIDTQAGMDAIVERAVEEPFTTGNAAAELGTDVFQRALLSSILAARDYHVLWIHDYAGRSANGNPDVIAFGQTVQGYLQALTNAVNAYDRTGRLPVFMIFIDENYYYANEGRRWLTVLERPLSGDTRLKGSRAMDTRLRRARRALAAAVAGSARLQADARRFGRRWLARTVAVHVSILNQPDWSSRTNVYMPSLPIVPTHLARDHRKIVVWDATESDPGRGGVIFTGAGVGEKYTSSVWEDRALLAQGPIALSARDAARRVLLRQGFRDSEIPPVLRPQPLAPDYAALVAARVDAGAVERLLSLHNEAGFAPKQATLAQAVLYTLMPPGSVIFVPSSIWTGALWAGQLLGAALRGCHVYIIMTSANSTSVSALMMARAYDLASELLAARSVLEPVIDSAHGRLRVGLFTREAPVGNLEARLREAADRCASDSLLLEEFPFVAELTRNMRQLSDSLRGAGYQANSLAFDFASPDPILHRKTQLLATMDAMNAIAAQARTWSLVLHDLLPLTNIEHPAGTIDMMSGYATSVAKELESAKQRLAATDADHATFYSTTGSLNQDAASAWINGEVLTITAGAPALASFFDFLELVGESTWVTKQRELDTYLPPPGRTTRELARMLGGVL